MEQSNQTQWSEVKKIKFHHRVKRFYYKNLFRKIYTVAIIGLIGANIFSLIKYQSFADTGAVLIGGTQNENVEVTKGPVGGSESSSDGDDVLLGGKEVAEDENPQTEDFYTEDDKNPQSSTTSNPAPFDKGAQDSDTQMDNQLEGQADTPEGVDDEKEGEKTGDTVGEMEDHSSATEQQPEVEDLPEVVEINPLPVDDNNTIDNGDTVGKDKIEDDENAGLENLMQLASTNNNIITMGEGNEGQQTTATLLPGKEFNAKIKSIAGNAMNYSYSDSKISKIEKSDTAPTEADVAITISTGDSVPVYAWYNSSTSTLYYHSDADIIYMNAISDHMFYNLTKLISLDVRGFNTSKVINMTDMFGGCSSLISLDLSSFNTSNVIEMSNMFFNCGKLTNLDLSNFNTSHVVNMYRMFYYCSSLTNLDLSSFNTSNVTNMNSMFSDCISLTSLDLSNWDTSKVTNMGNMFYYCRSLKTIYASNKFVAPSTYNMFYNTTNIVGGNGTKYDSSKTNNQYARIDKQGEPGYFTSKESTSVKFIANGEVYDTAIVPYGQKVLKPQTDPSLEGKNFSKWADEKGKEFDFNNTEITAYTEIYAKFDGNEAYLKPGQEVKSILTSLAGSTSNIQYIKETSELPAEGTMTEMLSALYSDKDVIARYDSESKTIYYHTYATKIYLSSDSSQMFYNFTNLKTLDISKFDTSKVTNMSSMFSYCNSLVSLDLSSFNTSNVTNMNSMFSSCYSLVSLDLSSFNTSNVTNMNSMFSSCNSLISLDLSSFDTSNVTDMRNMLRSNDFRTVYASNKFVVQNPSHMFYYTEKIIGGNGTKYDSSKYNGEYARLDKQGEPGYFTSKESIAVKFIVNGEIYDKTIVSYGQKVSKPQTNPSIEGKTFLKWIDENGEEFDFDNTEITAYTEIYAKFEGNDALLKPGQEFNSILTNLAGYASYIRYFEEASELPTEGINTEMLSVPYSDKDVIARYDSQSKTIYYYIEGYTESTKIYLNSDSSKMFYEFSNLKSLNLSKFDTSKVTNMQGMFWGCRSLTSLDVSKFDTSNVTNMTSMFNYCSSLTGLDTSNFNTSNVTDMHAMFHNCTNLISLDVSKFDTSNVTDMTSMFTYCSSLTSLNLSNFDTSNVTSMQSMFSSCSNLTSLDLSNRDTSKVTSMYQIFYSSSNLKTVYVSSKFVAPYDRYMFDYTRNIVGQKGTTYSKASSEYARIDMEGQPGYFWTHECINFVENGGSEVENPVFDDNHKCNVDENAVKPTRKDSQFIGWYTKDGEKWDFSQNNEELITLYAKYECKNGYVEYNNRCNFEAPGITYHDGWIKLSNGSDRIYLRDKNVGATKTGALIGPFKGDWISLLVEYLFQKYAESGKYSSESEILADETFWDEASSKVGCEMHSLEDYQACVNKYSNSDVVWYEDDNYVSSIGDYYYRGNNVGVPFTELNYDGNSISIPQKYIDEGFTGGNIGKENTGWEKDSKQNNPCDASKGEYLPSPEDWHKLIDMRVEYKGYYTLSSDGYVMDKLGQGRESIEILDFDNDLLIPVKPIIHDGTLDFNVGGLFGAKNNGVSIMIYEDMVDFMYNYNLPIEDGEDFNQYAMQVRCFVHPIKVQFVSEGEIIDTRYTDEYVLISEPTEMKKDGYNFMGWYTANEGGDKWDFDNDEVEEDVTLYAHREKIKNDEGNVDEGNDSNQPTNTQSGGGKRISKTDTTKDTHASAEDKEETQNEMNLDTLTVLNNEESNTSYIDSSVNSQNDLDVGMRNPIYSTEQNQAYQFAKSKGITTQSNIQNANIDGKLTRIQMAKMLSNYAINVLGQSPDISKGTVRFADVSSKLDKQYDNGVTLAYQLGIMGINMQDNKFRPNAYVTRAEFATALSRMLYGTPDGTGKIEYYVPHMAKLYNEGIITNTNSSMKEKRGFVMLMLMRSVQ